MVREIKKMEGIQPQLRDYLALQEKAMVGDIVMTISPATATPAPVTGTWSNTVTATLATAAGEVHTWVNTAVATNLTAAESTSGGGTADPSSTTLTIVNGVATITFAGTSGTWANADTATLTIADIVIAGVTVTGGTSVNTFTTP